MDPAFLRRIEFPPPPAGSFVLAREYRAGARAAADAPVTLRVKRMYRDVMLPQVLPHRRLRPVSQRAELCAAVQFLGLGNLAARFRLLTAQAHGLGG